MIAIYLEASRPSILERSIPEAPPGEALVRVTLAGVCATDLELIRGYMGFRGVPGHEFAGVVEGPEDHPLAGKRVVGEINCGCGSCTACRSGSERHCPDRTVLGILGRDGAFAEYLCLPDRNLHKIPEGVSDEEAVFCEPIAACYEVLEQRPGLAEAEVLVIGDGRLGLLQAQVLKLAGARVSILGRHPGKMARLDGLGIPAHTEPGAARPEEGARWPAVVEATGSAEGFETACHLVRPLGTLVLKSTVAGATPLNLAPLVIDEIDLVGSRCGPFAPALKALAGGRLRTGPLIDGRFALAEGIKAIDKAGEKGILKILIEP